MLSGLPDAEMEYEGLNVAFRLKPLPPAELIELVRDVDQRPKRRLKRHLAGCRHRRRNIRTDPDTFLHPL